MRITEHPILKFENKDEITFYYNGEPVKAYKTDTVASALHNAGIRKLSTSSHLHNSRGLFCAIGNCSSCFMTVDNVPNVRICVLLVKEGMDVRSQEDRGEINFV